MFLKNKNTKHIKFIIHYLISWILIISLMKYVKHGEKNVNTELLTDNNDILFIKQSVDQ